MSVWKTETDWAEKGWEESDRPDLPQWVKDKEAQEKLQKAITAITLVYSGGVEWINEGTTGTRQDHFFEDERMNEAVGTLMSVYSGGQVQPQAISGAQYPSGMAFGD